MVILSLDDFLKNIDFFIQEAKSWKIFIYPTDTVYGIWSIVNNQTISKIYKIKERDLAKPFSIVAPNIGWIKDNFIVQKDFDDYLKNSLNKYHWITILLYKKDKTWQPLLGKWNLVWVRILKHDFQKFVSKLWEWFITTSANISWQPSVDSIKLISKDIISKVDYIIDWGELFGKPSVILDLSIWIEKFRDN